MKLQISIYVLPTIMRALNRNILCRPLYITSRKYCENKSIYQKHEEAAKNPQLHSDNRQWRKPWIKREGEWTSKLAVFTEKNPNPDIMYLLSKAPELNIQKVKEWWAEMKVLQEIENQKYLPQRVATLGPNLAAMHFFLYRRATVRLRGSSEWMAGDATNLDLPSVYAEDYYVEAVDCTNFHHNGIRYEGIQNLTGLNFLKWLSLKNNKHIDVWCIDRIAGQNGRTLEYLDISGCQLCVGCVFALVRMKALKYLVITDPGDNIELQSAISMLEEEKSNLLIKTIENTNETNSSK